MHLVSPFFYFKILEWAWVEWVTRRLLFSFFNFFFFWINKEVALFFTIICLFKDYLGEIADTYFLVECKRQAQASSQGRVCVLAIFFFSVHNFFWYNVEPTTTCLSDLVGCCYLAATCLSFSLSCVCLFSVSGPGRERDSFFRKRLDLSHWPAAVWCGPVISPGAAAAAANVRETNERITPTSLSLSPGCTHLGQGCRLFFSGFRPSESYTR